MFVRFRFWLPVLAAWGAALGALYLHPAFWALFAALVAVMIYERVRAWRAH